MPLLIYNLNVEDSNYHSVIDILIRKNAFSLILSLCNTALKQDITGLMYEELTRYLESLNFSKSFVRSYLASEICFGTISVKCFKEFQDDDREIIHPCNDYDTHAEIENKFDVIQAEMLGKKPVAIVAVHETALKVSIDNLGSS